jgi:heterodisulfide reductase subunit C
MAEASLRLAVLNATGQDVRKCQHCSFCDEVLDPDQDLTLQSLLQLVVMNDEEVLTSRTLWSEWVLRDARHLCTSGLDIPAILSALRTEALRRGLVSHRPGAQMG